MNSLHEMVPVTAANPCQVCKKPDWCLIAPDGSACLCQRTESAKRCGDAGWLHKLAEPVAAPPAKPKKAKPSKPRDWQAEAERNAANLQRFPEPRARLAEKLGLPVDAFAGFTLGMNGKRSDGAEFTIPERDGKENIIGLATRIERKGKGKPVEKKAIHGSKRGLTIPDGWRDKPGPLLFAEGFTDTAALTAAGLCGIGRANFGHGADLLAELLASWPPERGILVVADNDEHGAGLKGAIAIARKLSALLGRRVPYAMPPDGSKDVRQWLTAEERGESPWPQRGAELLRLLKANATNAPSMPVDAPSKFQLGERVSPTDRENVGTIMEVLEGKIYRVRFVGERGEAEKDFPESELRSLTPTGNGPPVPPRIIPEYRPFPVDALPPTLREFSEQVAASVGCDVAFAALPAITLAGAAVGASVVAKPKRGWKEPPAIWACIVADSGTGKSPAMKDSSTLAFGIDRELREAHIGAVAKYKQDCECYAKKMESFDRADGAEEPEKPRKPKREYFAVVDATIERLAEMLGDSPRGLLVVRDELAGWFGSFSRYKGKAGGTDVPNWLSLFDCGPIRVHRRTGEPRDIETDRAFAAVCGGIQPDILARHLAEPGYVESGLAARIIFAAPPKYCPGWRYAELDSEAERKFGEVLQELR